MKAFIFLPVLLVSVLADPGYITKPIAYTTNYSPAYLPFGGFNYATYATHYTPYFYSASIPGHIPTAIIKPTIETTNIIPSASIFPTLLKSNQIITPTVEIKSALPNPTFGLTQAISGTPTVETKSVPAIETKSGLATEEKPEVKSSPAIETIPVIAPLLTGIEKAQYHAQDELGQASYGHSEAFQKHDAMQDASGNKAGSFSYVAPSGEIFTTNYAADEGGYRVLSNAVASDLPATPHETPEVAAARAAHLQAHENAKHRTRRALYPLTYSNYYAAPLAYYNTPTFYSTFYNRPATLTTTVNNPGHAISYRIE